jgi:hypothetical protein
MIHETASHSETAMVENELGVSGLASEILESITDLIGFDAEDRIVEPDTRPVRVTITVTVEEV